MHLVDIYRQLATTRWNIGFLTHVDAQKTPFEDFRVNWLKHDIKTSWFADPFILSKDEDNIEVLVEEWVENKKRGIISKLDVSHKDFSLRQATPILELDTHLSFPQIIRRNGEIFVCPENSQAKNLTVYRYDKAGQKLEKAAVVCDIPLTDAIIDCENFGENNFIFSTDASSPNGSVLSVYQSDDFLGKYTKVSEISFADKTARNAGAYFKAGKDIIRPAQDCNKRYGAGLVFHKIDFDGKNFKFTELRRHFPCGSKRNLGLHTFNFLSDTAVVDGYAYKTPVLGKILNESGMVKFAIAAKRFFK